MDYGFFRVAAAVPRVRIADVDFNSDAIINLIDKAEEEQASLVVFPELSVTGYTCLDLFGQSLLLTASEEAVKKIAVHTRGKHVTVVVGAPVRYRGRLYNCAVVIRNGGIKGIVPKSTCRLTPNSTRDAGSPPDLTSWPPPTPASDVLSMMERITTETVSTP